MTTANRRTPVVPCVIPATLHRMHRPTFRDLTLHTAVGRRTYAMVCALLLALLGALVTFAAPAVPASTVSQVSISGLSASNGWLCRTWGYDGYTWTHCTHEWHQSGSALVSDNPAWVPNSRTSVVPSPYVPTWVWQGAQAALARGGKAQPLARGSTPAVSQNSSALVPNGIPICQWCYTGLAAHALSAHANVYPWGQCTDYAQMRAPALWGLGDAWSWAGNARARGLPTGNTPQVGATVVFQGGVQGASALGHVAHVEQVFSGGWFLVSETNFFWNGGGFGRVDYRFAQTGPGVSFIYA